MSPGILQERFANRPKNDGFEGFDAAAALEDSPFSLLLSTCVTKTVVLLSVLPVPPRGGEDDSDDGMSTMGMMRSESS
jgi:hypothetical protein